MTKRDELVERKAEPVAHIVERRDGSRRAVMLVEKYDPRDPDFWLNEEARHNHIVTPLFSAAPSPVDSRDDRDFEWKLVPIKPTLEMAEKGAEAFSLPHPQSVGAENERAALIYRLMLGTAPSQVDSRDALIERLVKALEEIVNPIEAMRQHAADEGSGLDGLMAVTLAKDPEYLKGIARAALSLPAQDRDNA